MAMDLNFGSNFEFSSLTLEGTSADFLALKSCRIRPCEAGRCLVFIAFDKQTQEVTQI